MNQNYVHMQGIRRKCNFFSINPFTKQNVGLIFSPPRASRVFGILHFSPLIWRNSMTHSMRKKCRPQITCSASWLTHMQRSAFRHCNNPLGKRGKNTRVLENTSNVQSCQCHTAAAAPAMPILMNNRTHMQCLQRNALKARVSLRSIAIMPRRVERRTETSNKSNTCWTIFHEH